jgi:hypothetical protein
MLLMLNFILICILYFIRPVPVVVGDCPPIFFLFFFLFSSFYLFPGCA